MALLAADQPSVDARALLEWALAYGSETEPDDDDDDDDDDDSPGFYRRFRQRGELATAAIVFAGMLAARRGETPLVPLLMHGRRLVLDGDPDRNNIEQLATAIVSLVNQGAELTPDVAALGKSAWAVERSAMSHLDPAVPGAVPVLQVLAGDPSRWTAQQARKSLAGVATVAWWHGWFDQDPLLLVSANEAAAAEPLLRDSMHLLAGEGFESDQARGAKLMAAIDALPEPIARALAYRLVVNDVDGPPADAVIARLMACDDGPALAANALADLGANPKRSLYGWDDVLGKDLRADLRLPLARALLPHLQKRPDGTWRPGTGDLTSVVVALWPDDGDPALLYDAVDAMHAPSHADLDADGEVGSEDGGEEADAAEGEDAVSARHQRVYAFQVVDRLRSCAAASARGKDLALPLMRNWIGDDEGRPLRWPNVRRWLYPHQLDLTPDQLRPLAEAGLRSTVDDVRAWAVDTFLDRCWSAERDPPRLALARAWAQDPTLPAEAREHLQDHLLPDRRAALRAGNVTLQEAAKTLRDLASGHRLGSEAARDFAEGLVPRELLGPVTDEELAIWRRLRSEADRAERNFWWSATIVLWHVPWSPADVALAHEAVATARAGDRRAVLSLGMAIGSNPTLELLPLLDDLIDVVAGDDRETLRYHRSLARKHLGIARQPGAPRPVRPGEAVPDSPEWMDQDD